MRSLEQNFRIPGYLSNMLKDYLRDRNLQYDTLDGKRQRMLSAGIAQGSVLGPDLWNAFYDGLLRLNFPTGVSLIGYADDVALAIAAEGMELAQQTLNEVMRLIHLWIEGHGLQLAIPKTEIVVLTHRRIPTEIDIHFDDRRSPHTISTRTSVKYLGVLLDNKLTFHEHFQKSCQKAAEVTKSLSRLMANVGGPRSGRRRLLMSTVNSILLYGSEVWAPIVQEKKKYLQMITAVQRRGALRIACAYQTVSAVAIQVVAGVVPIDLMANERSAVYTNRNVVSRDEASAQARLKTMRDWQSRWDAHTKGRWTHRLIPNIQEWIGRAHGEMDFYLTQFLTGHGYFRERLAGWKKVADPWCRHCVRTVDSVEHTFFECAHYAEGRPPFREWRPETVVQKMLHSTENWYSVAKYVRTTLMKKRDDGFLEN